MTAPRKTTRRKTTTVTAAALEAPDAPSIAAVPTAVTITDPNAGADETVDEPVEDLDSILPDPTKLVVAGIPVWIRRLQTRELLLAIRAITAGMGVGLTRIDLTGDLEEQMPVIAGLLITAIPDAPDEFLGLLRAVTVPRETADAKARDDLAAIMANPPIDVTMDVLLAILVQEKDDLMALVGKARQMLSYVQALYRTGKRGT